MGGLLEEVVNGKFIYGPYLEVPRNTLQNILSACTTNMRNKTFMLTGGLMKMYEYVPYRELYMKSPWKRLRFSLRCSNLNFGSTNTPFFGAIFK